MQNTFLKTQVAILGHYHIPANLNQIIFTTKK